MNSVYLEDQILLHRILLHRILLLLVTSNLSFSLNPTKNPIDLLYKCAPDWLGDVASEYKYMPTPKVSGV